MTDRPLTAWENRLQYDLIEPEAFQIVENQRLPKTTTPFLIESALQGFSVTRGSRSIGSVTYGVLVPPYYSSKA